MKKHQNKVKAQEGHKYTRSSRKQSQSEQNKSAITDRVNQENHVINWNEAKIITRESHKTTRWIHETVQNRQESQSITMATSGERQQTAVRGRQQLLSKRH